MSALLAYWPAILATLLGLLTLWLWSRQSRAEAFPYEPRESLLTRNEQAFYAALREAVQDDWDIFAMVRLADLIRVRAATGNRQSWQNRINCKHVDFVLCDHYELRPRLAIEVDDRSHRRADRVERDAFLDEALATAELPLLRVEAQRDYDAGVLRQRIDEILPPSTRPRVRASRTAQRKTGQTSNHSRP